MVAGRRPTCYRSVRPKLHRTGASGRRRAALTFGRGAMHAMSSGSDRKRGVRSMFMCISGGKLEHDGVDEFIGAGRSRRSYMYQVNRSDRKKVQATSSPATFTARKHAAPVLSS